MATIDNDTINDALQPVRDVMHKMPYGGTAQFATVGRMPSNLPGDTDVTDWLAHLLGVIAGNLEKLRVMLVQVAAENSQKAAQLDRIRGYAYGTNRLDELAGHIQQVDDSYSADQVTQLADRASDLQLRLAVMQDQAQGKHHGLWMAVNDALVELADLALIVDGGGRRIPTTTHDEHKEAF